MPHRPGHIAGGTDITEPPTFDPNEGLTDRQVCERDGGFWDAETETCLNQRPTELQKLREAETPDEPGRAPVTTPESFTDVETGTPSGITIPGRRGGADRTFFGLSKQEIEEIAAREQGRDLPPEGTVPVGTAQAQARLQQESQRLAGQVGAGTQLGISPTGLDFGEAATQGIVQGSPRALSLIGGAIAGGALIGGKIGATGGTAAAPGAGTAVGGAAGAAIGAGIGLVAGIAGSMISNFRSQRTDTTTAQQRVLDEGKQTLKDWATLAEADPVNRVRYLAEFNKVAAQIDQAYRQMKLDTSRDIAKFETALPNLAEFEAYYAPGGESDVLFQDMRNALVGQSTPEYNLLELTNRRGQDSGA